LWYYNGAARQRRTEIYPIWVGLTSILSNNARQISTFFSSHVSGVCWCYTWVTSMKFAQCTFSSMSWCLAWFSDRS
jgi:hypothetical protein